MASPIQHILTIDQTANGDNNNTASREGGQGPIIDADGWYALGPDCKRFDIDLVGTNTAVFDVACYIKDISGNEISSNSASFTANGTTSIFQEPTTATHVKIKVENYSSGTLNASIRLV